MKMRNIFLPAIFCFLAFGSVQAQSTVTPATTTTDEHGHPITPAATTTTGGTNVVTPTAPTPGGGVFKWSETTYAFGKIEQGTPVTHKFTFTNVGTEAITISEAKRTCGCTGLEWSKESIPVGGEGWVEATFNAAAAGPFNKTIFVVSNASETNVGLTFSGEVLKKEELNLNNNTMMNNPTGN